MSLHSLHFAVLSSLSSASVPTFTTEFILYGLSTEQQQQQQLGTHRTRNTFDKFSALTSRGHGLDLPENNTPLLQLCGQLPSNGRRIVACFALVS
jgi:hypothetical protein